MCEVCSPDKGCPYGQKPAAGGPHVHTQAFPALFILRVCFCVLHPLFSVLVATLEITEVQQVALFTEGGLSLVSGEPRWGSVLLSPGSYLTITTRSPDIDKDPIPSIYTYMQMCTQKVQGPSLQPCTVLCVCMCSHMYRQAGNHCVSLDRGPWKFLVLPLLLFRLGLMQSKLVLNAQCSKG